MPALKVWQSCHLLLLSLSLLMLGACATPEYLANEAHCTPDALDEYPPEFESRWVTRSYTEYVHDGGYRCERDRRGETCRPTAVPVQVLRQNLESVDINQHARDTRIRACTRKRCVEDMGNPECKPRR